MSRFDRREFLSGSAGALAALAFIPELRATPFRAAAPVDVAIIGLGRQGRAIVSELSTIENVRIAAMCDVDERRLESGRRRAQDAAAFADHAAMLSGTPESTAIIVATPTHTHRQIVEDAIAAGRHVYCEAPLASNVEDARAIARAARAGKTVFQSGLQARSNPVYKLARTFFLSDAVRDLVSMSGEHARKTSWRTPVSDPAREKALNWRLDPDVSIGLTGEMGTQQFDVFHWYLDRFPVRIRGGGDIRAYNDGREIPDTVHAILSFDDGATLVYQATIASSYADTHELLRGTNATIKLAWTHGWMFKEADAPTQGWEVYANRQQFHNDEGITLIADATKLASQGKLKEGVGLPYTPLHYALVDFIKSVSEDAPVVCTAEDGLRATVVGIRSHEAVMTGREIDITPEDLRTG